MEQVDDPQLAIAVARIVSMHGALPVARQVDAVGELAYLFEDPYSIIGVASFASGDSVVAHWLESQDALMRAVTRAGGEIGAKAWDTYLILVVEEPIPSALSSSIAEIRSNTRYARKLVVSIGDLTSDPTMSDEFNLSRSLAPILPLVLPADIAYRDPLLTLPERLGGTGVDADTLSAVISAHRRGLPLIAELHSRLTGEEVSE